MKDICLQFKITWAGSRKPIGYSAIRPIYLLHVCPFVALIVWEYFITPINSILIALSAKHYDMLIVNECYKLVLLFQKTTKKTAECSFNRRKYQKHIKTYDLHISGS